MRGGCGMMREIKCLGERTTLTIGSDRRKFTPWGLDGGHNAEGAHCWVIGTDGAKKELPTKVVTTLTQGDRLLTQTPGGGGWGDPNERDPTKIAGDIRDGLVSDHNA